MAQDDQAHCPTCGVEGEVVDIGSASGRKHYRCPTEGVGVQGREKNPAAVALGRLGGIASADALTPAQRTQRARDAVQKRWRKEKLRKNVVPEIFKR